MNQAKHSDFRENVIIFLVLTGMLLPARLVFVNFVSSWFGSLGVISAVSVVIFVLTKKGKLGKFGKMFQRQMLKMQRRKRSKVVYGCLTFSLIMNTIFVSAITLGNTAYSDIKSEMLKEEDLTTKDRLMERAKNISALEWLGSLLLLVFAFVFAFPQVASAFSIVNDMSSGWLIHFQMVALVEQLEFFGLLLYFRFSYRNMKEVRNE